MKRLILPAILFVAMRLSAATTLIAEGDSITWWIAPGYGYPYIGTTNQLWSPTFYTNLATGGSTFTTITNRAATADGFYTNGYNNVISVLIGANDIGGYTDSQVTNYVNNIKGYFLDRRAKGFLTLICTVTPRTNANFSAPRAKYNALVRADSSWYDGIADFAADATMGPDAAAADLTLYSDGLHPTTLGEQTLANVYRPAASNLLTYVAPIVPRTTIDRLTIQQLQFR